MLTNLTQQYIGNQHQAEANQKGIGSRSLISVVVGLGDHLVADDKKHGAPCEGQS